MISSFVGSNGKLIERGSIDAGGVTWYVVKGATASGRISVTAERCVRGRYERKGDFVSVADLPVLVRRLAA